MFVRAVIFILFALAASTALAQNEIYDFDTENQRNSYAKLSVELRCPKCQNQNLADSNSDISEAMRDVIAEELISGKTESEIKQMMVDRYGEFVLYKPPVNMQTLVLWWAPVIFLLIVFVILLTVVARRRKYVEDEFEDDADSERLGAESVGTKKEHLEP